VVDVLVGEEDEPEVFQPEPRVVEPRFELVDRRVEPGVDEEESPIGLDSYGGEHARATPMLELEREEVY
jgi:hypothetical protein